MPVGPQMIAYNGVPIFANDNLLKTQTQGASTNASSIIAGTLDDGSGMVGISGLTAENAAGMMVEDVGTHQSKDEHIYRIKWYSSVALFNLNGLAVASGIIP